MITQEQNRDQAVSRGRPDVPAPALRRLCAVELRKLIDTRAGVVLIIVGAIGVGVFGGGAVLFRQQPTIDRIALLAGVPATTLIPVLAALLITSERSQHTASTTFALVPRRGRVLTAKLIAVVISAIMVALLCLLAALIIGAVGPVLSGKAVSWTIDWTAIGALGLGAVVAALTGAALGLLLGNAPAAIVIVLVWPMISLPLMNLPKIGTVLSWLDFSSVSRFTDGVTGLEAGQAAVGFTAWVIIPTVVGWISQLRTEVR